MLIVNFYFVALFWKILLCVFLHTVQLQREEEREHGSAAASWRVLGWLLACQRSSRETITVEASVPSTFLTKCAAQHLRWRVWWVTVELDFHRWPHTVDVPPTSWTKGVASFRTGMMSIRPSWWRWVVEALARVDTQYHCLQCSMPVVSYLPNKVMLCCSAGVWFIMLKSLLHWIATFFVQPQWIATLSWRGMCT
jgi:hypothetical protein